MTSFSIKTFFIEQKLFRHPHFVCIKIVLLIFFWPYILSVCRRFRSFIEDLRKNSGRICLSVLMSVMTQERNELSILKIPTEFLRAIQRAQLIWGPFVNSVTRYCSRSLICLLFFFTLRRYFIIFIIIGTD